MSQEMIQADDAKAKLQVRQNTLALIASRFQSGIHYHVIKGNKSLSKGGAEEYNTWMGLLAHIDHDKETRELCGSPDGWLFMRCDLLSNGNIVGTGRGAFRVSDAQGDYNKAVKMCQKRAYVDATLRVGGLTAIGFTQDLEDDPSASPSPTREPGPVSVQMGEGTNPKTPLPTPAPVVPLVPQGPPGTIERVVDTPFQKAKRRLKADAKSKDVTVEVVQKIVRETEQERAVRMKADAEKVFGDEKGAVVWESKNGDNAPASPMEWRRCAIVAKDRGMDDQTRRRLCMSKVAELRGVTVESLGEWDAVKPTVTMAEIEQVTAWFRKGV